MLERLARCTVVAIAPPGLPAACRPRRPLLRNLSPRYVKKIPPTTALIEPGPFVT